MGMSRHDQRFVSPLLSLPTQVTDAQMLDSSKMLSENVPHAIHSNHTKYHSVVVRTLVERRALLDVALARFAEQGEPLAELASRIVEALRSGHKVLVAGNGGSAAEAQHFAAELVGRFKRERSPYAVLALTTDTAILTAVANDYGYADVFARQVCAFGQADDLFLAFSTSGESENLVRAAQVGRERLMTVAAITGERTSRLERLSNITIRVPQDDTPIIQELHMMATHILCDIVETELSSMARPLNAEFNHTLDSNNQNGWQ
jgi:D-sedoheptulose 7-phosphate isomerase